MRFVIIILFPFSTGTRPAELAELPSFADNLEVDENRILGERAIYDLSSAESSTGASRLRGSTFDEDKDRLFSWEDALAIFEGSITKWSDVWENDDTHEDQPEVTVPRFIPSSAKEILLEEMIHSGIEVPVEQVLLRVKQELPMEQWTVYDIRKLRGSILLLFVQPLWFHELLIAHRTASKGQLHRIIAARFDRTLSRAPSGTSIKCL